MKKENMKQIGDILLNIIGSALLAFGVCAFVEPFGLIVGGATGISLVIHRLFHFKISTVAMAINIGVLPLCLIGKEKNLFWGSILSSLAYPVALGVFERIPVITTIADNTFLAVICGGIICGCGIGLVMKSGGSTGGVDIPIMILHRYIKMPVSKIMNATDTCIMLCQIPLFGLNSIIYGLIYTYIMTESLNKMLTHGEDCIRISIISENYEAIRQTLIQHDFGLTMIYSESGYTYTKILKIESVMRSAAYRKARRLIEEVDPEAFITIENVRNVHGRGYTMERLYIDMD